MRAASARERYTPEELAGSGLAGDLTWGPLICVKSRHPARLHWQSLWANVANHHWVPIWPSRRDGAYREQWMLNRSYLLQWPLARWSRWCRENGHPRLQPMVFFPWLDRDEAGDRIGLAGWLRRIRS